MTDLSKTLKQSRPPLPDPPTQNAGEFRYSRQVVLLGAAQEYAQAYGDACIEAAITALREALAAPQPDSTAIHSCSYYCDRPDCIKAQRDELREAFAKPVVPPGYALAPVEATREMVWACKDRFIPRIALPFFVAAYKTMIAAAPQPKDKP